MEAFLYSLLAAAMTGLAWLAYSNPKAYSRLFVWLAAALGVAIVASVSMQIGANTGLLAFKPHIPASETTALETVLSGLMWPMTTTSVALVVGLLYAVFLRLLPKILGLDGASNA